MSAWKRVPDGPYYLDWQRRGIGRICVSSGTRRLKVFRRIEAMLGDLYDQGRLDVLRAIKEQTHSVMTVFDAHRRGRLDLLPLSESLTPLRPAVDAWIARAGDTGRRAANYRTALNRMLRHAHGDSIVHDLPDCVQADRLASQDSGQVTSHNRARAACLAFLRDTLGKEHAVYRMAVAVPALPPAVREDRPRLSVAQAEKIRDGLPGALGAAWWSLCLTGMIISEFWGAWYLRTDHVRVRGTKTGGRDRRVPWIAALRRPACTRRELSAALTALELESYDARRAFAHWMEEAGIPRARRKGYLGHKPSDTTDLYEMGDLSRYLREDGAKLRAYLVRESRKMSPRAQGRRRA